METIVERPAALDVHKESVTACVRVPGLGGRREQHVEEFKTTVAGLLTLRDWLTAHRVSAVAMEATGVYWKPVWAILEDEFDCLLVNARHVKQVPGRKTDVSDAAWLCQLLEAGLLRRSFVPPKRIRASNARRARAGHHRSAGARRAREGQAAGEDPGAQGSARRSFRPAARADRLGDPRPPRLPRRADPAALRRDRGAALPFRGRG